MMKFKKLTAEDFRKLRETKHLREQMRRRNWEQWKRENNPEYLRQKYSYSGKTIKDKIMDETLKGAYKELWREYQNQETIEIKDLTMDQLIQRIAKWEEIEFEARSKRQKCEAEKRERLLKVEREGRDALISDPKYVSPDGPTSKSKPYPKKSIVKGERRSKEEKLEANLGELGLDLGDLMKEVAAKKKAGVQNSLNSSVRQGE